MKTMMKKLTLLLSTMALLLGIFPAITFAEETDSLGQVQVIVENTTFSKAKGAAWAGTLVDEKVTLKKDSTTMSCITDALGEIPQKGAEKGYISNINGLEEFDGGEQAGWMGTLNDWFTNEGFDAYSVANKGLADGDVIRVMYSLNYGADLGGDYAITATTLSNLEFSEGVLTQKFDENTFIYNLLVPKSAKSLKVTPTAKNKNFQVRTFSSAAEADSEKCTADGYDLEKTDAKAFNSGIGRSKAVPLSSDGTTTIKVVCAGKDWPGSQGTPSVYTINVTAYDGAITVPADANLKVERKQYSAYNYQPFESCKEFLCLTDKAAGTKTYYYTNLRNNSYYYYRVSGDNYITYAGYNIFKSSQTWNLAVTKDMLQTKGKTKKTVDRNVKSNNGSNVADVFMNINAQGYLKMKEVESTYQLIHLRNWEAIDGQTTNNFVEPDYHYTVINEEGDVDNSVITISDKGVIEAKNKGTAIVLVTYDAMNYAQGMGGSFYGAIWPENTGVFVVSVGAEESGITTGMTVNEGLNNATGKQAVDAIDAELDIVYFVGDKGSYTFTPKTTGCKVSVANPIVGNRMKFSGFVSVKGKKDGSYNVPLTEGRNIVKISKNGKCEYQVITAKELKYTINNGEEVHPGDQINIVFDTIYHPVNKMAGAYNFFASVTYKDENGVLVGGSASQYNFASNSNTQNVNSKIRIDTTYPWMAVQKSGKLVAEDVGEMKLTSGALFVVGWGDEFGNHRGMTLESGKAPNPTAATRIGYFGVLPDITIEVTEGPAGLVTEKINAIGKVTLNSGKKIEEARAAYEALSDEEKKQVESAALRFLKNAEETYQELVDADNQEKANVVKDKIDAIGEVTLESADAIKAARSAYEALTADQKTALGKDSLKKLTDAEKAYKELTSVKVKSINITGLSYYVAAGKKMQLKASVSPSNATNKKVVWSSSNKKVATVSSTGLVTMCKKPVGKSVTITAKATDGSNVKKTFKIYPKSGVVTKVSISGKKTLTVGKSTTLKASVKATKGAYKSVKWTSSNTKYATVSSKGVVKAMKAGKKHTVTITALARDGSGKKATFKIAIK